MTPAHSLAPSFSNNSRALCGHRALQFAKHWPHYHLMQPRAVGIIMASLSSCGNRGSGTPSDLLWVTQQLSDRELSPDSLLPYFVLSLPSSLPPTSSPLHTHALCPIPNIPKYPWKFPI